MDLRDENHQAKDFPEMEFGTSLLTVRFSDLKWLLAIFEAFLLERLESKYGKSILELGPRKRVFNIETAAYFLVEGLGLIFDENTNQFFTRARDSKEFSPLPKNKLNELISLFFHQQVRNYGSQYPIGKLPSSAVVTFLKTVCGVERPDEFEALNLYLRERLQRRPGSDLTTHEILADYNEYCKTSSLPTFPECVFRDKLAKTIREQFNLTKSHNILRPNTETGRLTAKYGFNGLGIKANAKANETASAEAGEPKEAKEAAEQPEGVIK